jgi:hypothetical protein
MYMDNKPSDLTNKEKTSNNNSRYFFMTEWILSYAFKNLTFYKDHSCYCSLLLDPVLYMPFT